MPFVQRDPITQDITGVFANLQPGFAVDWLADSDPMVLSFLQRDPPLDWEKLYISFQSSVFLGKANAAAQISLPAGTALMFVISAVTNTKDVNDLAWAVTNVREAMVATTIGDFTPEEIESINLIFIDCNFTFQLT